jgi:hypothetical protein
VLTLTLGCGMEMDVSLNDDGGVKAARLMEEWVSVALCRPAHDAVCYRLA